MKNDIQSHNTTVGATGKDFLVPTGPQVLIYILIGVTVLTALNLTRIWDYLNRILLAPQGGLNNFIEETLPWLHNLLSSLAQSIIIQVAFWVFVGIIVYVIIWFTKNVFINLMNDVVADNYIHPASYDRTSFWASVLARKIFFGVTLVILALYFYASSQFLPILATAAYQAVANFTLIRSTLEIIEAILGTAIWLHLLLLVAHTSINSWRLINRDL